jgi:hypothetical protein
MPGAEHVRKVDHLAGLDQLDGVEHDLRFHEIAGAALVAGAPFRRQRALSGGTAQDGACAREAVLAMSTALIVAANAMHFMGFPPGDI